MRVELLADDRRLRAARLVRIGRFLRRGVPAGRLKFTVRLNAKARRALRNRKRLTVRLRTTIVSPRGSKATEQHTIVFRH